MASQAFISWNSCLSPVSGNSTGHLCTFQLLSVLSTCAHTHICAGAQKHTCAPPYILEYCREVTVRRHKRCFLAILPPVQLQQNEITHIASIKINFFSQRFHFHPIIRSTVNFAWKCNVIPHFFERDMPEFSMLRVSPHRHLALLKKCNRLQF